MIDKNENKEIAQSIRDKIQLLITAELLIAAMVYGFFKAQGVTETISNQQNLAWYIGIAVSILNYLFVGLSQIFKIWFLKCARFFASLTLFLLAIAVIVMALAEYKPLPGYFGWYFYIAINGSLWLPIATLIILIDGIYWSMIFDIWKGIKSYFKRKKS